MIIEEQREAYTLKQFLTAPECSLKKLPGTKANPKGLDLDNLAKDELRTRLIEKGFLATAGAGKKQTLTLTPSGIDAAKRAIWPPPPPPPNAKFQALVLLNVLGADELSLRHLKALVTPALAKALDTPKAAVPGALDAMVGRHLLKRLDRDAEKPGEPDDRLAYVITEAGQQELVNLRQHADAQFKLNGIAINRLVEIARVHADKAQPTPARGPSGGTLTDADFLHEAGVLMRSHPNGLLPIYELRRRIRQKFGDRAAGTGEFDDRLMKLRGERLDLESLHDLTVFPKDQRDEGLRGVGELFFFVRDLR